MPLRFLDVVIMGQSHLSSHSQCLSFRWVCGWKVWPMTQGEQRPVDIFIFLPWAFWTSSPRQSFAVKEGQRWMHSVLSLPHTYTGATVYIGTPGSCPGCSFGNCSKISTVCGGRGDGNSHSQRGSNSPWCLLCHVCFSFLINSRPTQNSSFLHFSSTL